MTKVFDLSNWKSSLFLRWEEMGRRSFEEDKNIVLDMLILKYLLDQVWTSSDLLNIWVWSSGERFRLWL